MSSSYFVQPHPSSRQPPSVAANDEGLALAPRSFFRDIRAEAASSSPSSRLGLRYRAGLLAPQATTPQRLSPPPQKLVTPVALEGHQPADSHVAVVFPFAAPSPHKYNMVAEPSSRLADVLRRISPNRDDFLILASTAAAADLSAVYEQREGLQEEAALPESSEDEVRGVSLDHRRVVVTSVDAMMSLQEQDSKSAALSGLFSRSALFGVESAAKAPHPYDVPSSRPSQERADLETHEAVLHHKYNIDDSLQRKIDVSCIPHQEAHEEEADNEVAGRPLSEVACSEGRDVRETEGTSERRQDAPDVPKDETTGPAEATSHKKLNTPSRPPPPPPPKKHVRTSLFRRSASTTSDDDADEDETSPATDFRTPFQRAVAAYRLDPNHLLHPALEEVLAERESLRRSVVDAEWMNGLGALARWTLAGMRAVKLVGQEQEERALLLNCMTTTRACLMSGLEAVKVELGRFKMPLTFQAALSAGMSSASMKVGDPEKLISRRERIVRLARRSGVAIPAGIDIASPSRQPSSGEGKASPAVPWHHDLTLDTLPDRPLVELETRTPAKKQQNDKEAAEQNEDRPWSFTPAARPVELRDEPLPTAQEASSRPVRVQFSPIRDDDNFDVEGLPVSLVTPLLLSKNRGIPIVKMSAAAAANAARRHTAAPINTHHHPKSKLATAAGSTAKPAVLDLSPRKRQSPATKKPAAAPPATAAQADSALSTVANPHFSHHEAQREHPSPTNSVPAPVARSRGSSAVLSNRSVSSSSTSSSSSSLSSLDAASVSD